MLPGRSTSNRRDRLWSGRVRGRGKWDIDLPTLSEETLGSSKVCSPVLGIRVRWVDVELVYDRYQQYVHLWGEDDHVVGLDFHPVSYKRSETGEWDRDFAV